MLKLIKLPFRILRRIYLEIKKFFKRVFLPPNWKNLRHLKPVSNVFGLDRGTPIDRIYTQDFLRKNASHIQGVVCEIAENAYTKQWGGGASEQI